MEKELKAKKQELGQLFKVCPVCGYENGFHNSFRVRKDGDYDWLFVCPNCASVFNVGLVVPAPKR